MRKEIKNDIEEIKKVSAKFPKTLNEALQFNDLEETENIDEPQIEEPAHHEPQLEHESSSMDVMAFVDDIRKKSLKGMAELADNPDDEKYQLLKKIWQICDKKPEQQSVFNKPNTEQPNPQI